VPLRLVEKVGDADALCRPAASNFHCGEAALYQPVELRGSVKVGRVALSTHIWPTGSQPDDSDEIAGFARMRTSTTFGGPGQLKRWARAEGESRQAVAGERSGFAAGQELGRCCPLAWRRTAELVRGRALTSTVKARQSSQFEKSSRSLQLLRLAGTDRRRPDCTVGPNRSTVGVSILLKSRHAAENRVNGLCRKAQV